MTFLISVRTRKSTLLIVAKEEKINRNLGVQKSSARSRDSVNTDVFRRKRIVYSFVEVVKMSYENKRLSLLNAFHLLNAPSWTPKL